MPGLNVPCVRATKSASFSPSSLCNNLMCGTVASPTPTMPISSDSTSRTVTCLFSTRINAAAAIQPAVPPPTTTMLVMPLAIVVHACQEKEARPRGDTRAPREGASGKAIRMHPWSGLELEACGEAGGARHERDVARVVVLHRKAVRTDGWGVVDEVLPVEHVEDVEADIELGLVVLADHEILRGLDVDVAIAPDLAADEELRALHRPCDRTRTLTVAVDHARRTQYAVIRHRGRHGQLGRQRDAPGRIEGARADEAMLSHRVRGDERVVVDGRFVERVVLVDVTVLLGVAIGVREVGAPARLTRVRLVGRDQYLGRAGTDTVVADDHAAEARNAVAPGLGAALEEGAVREAVAQGEREAVVREHAGHGHVGL